MTDLARIRQAFRAAPASERRAFPPALLLIAGVIGALWVMLP